MDLVVLTSIAALVGVASGVLAFFVWVRQQVDMARQENSDDLRAARKEIYEQLRRELSAELRAELYKELLEAYSGENVRDRSSGPYISEPFEEQNDNDVNRLSDSQ